MKKLIYFLFSLCIVSIIGCSSNFYCKHCHNEMSITDSTIYHYKDSTLVIPIMETVPKDSVIFHFVDSIKDGTYYIVGKIASVEAHKKDHTYTIIARCNQQFIKDSIIYNLRFKTDQKAVVIRDKTAENLCTTYKSKIVLLNTSLIILIVLYIVTVGGCIYLLFKK